MDAAIGEFATTGGRPGAAAVIYVCSYGTEYNNRPFMLPVSANITRPADVLTQGVLAKSLIDALRARQCGPDRGGDRRVRRRCPGRLRAPSMC